MNEVPNSVLKKRHLQVASEESPMSSSTGSLNIHPSIHTHKKWTNGQALLTEDNSPCLMMGPPCATWSLWPCPDYSPGAGLEASRSTDYDATELHTHTHHTHTTHTPHIHTHLFPICIDNVELTGMSLISIVWLLDKGSQRQ